MASIIKKPRNARSKRALEKRQPQIHEATKTALFVNASQSSALVQKSLNQLTALKKPHAVSFSKKKSNDVNPFVDAGSIEFWCAKNDTPLMLVGDSRKKRKDNLTWIRLFDGRVLDMIEMGIDAVKGTEEFQVSLQQVRHNSICEEPHELTTFCLPPGSLQFGLIWEVAQFSILPGLNLQPTLHLSTLLMRS